MRSRWWMVGFVMLALERGMAQSQPALADQEIVLGGQCDRTGPTRFVGVVICPGLTDFIDLVNSKGGEIKTIKNLFH